MTKASHKIVQAIAVATFAFAALPSAQAIPTLQLTSGASTITIADGDAGDFSALSGAVTYVGSVGANWFLNVTTGVTKPVQGSATYPYLHLNSVDTSFGSGSLTLRFAESGFTSSSSSLGFLSTISSLVGGNGSISITNYWAPDDASSLSDLSLFSELTTVAPFGAGGTTGTQYGSLVPPSGFYTLMQEVVITHNGTGVTTTSFDAVLEVPDGGATVTLLGMALVGICALRRKLKA